MTETPGDYPGSQNVFCPGCTRVVGKYARQPDGRVYFRIGALQAYSFHGFCECGAPFHFSATDQAMRRLLAHYEKRAKIIDIRTK